jgi:hypothetical protein
MEMPSVALGSKSGPKPVALGTTINRFNRVAEMQQSLVRSSAPAGKATAGAHRLAGAEPWWVPLQPKGDLLKVSRRARFSGTAL